MNLKDLNNELENNKLFKKMSTLRRRLIRVGLKNKNKVVFIKDIDFFNQKIIKLIWKRRTPKYQKKNL